MDDDQVRTVPLDLDEGPDREIDQQNVGYANMGGSGEWPSPDSPPSGPAPGTAGEGGHRTGAKTHPHGTGTQPGLQQDGTEAGDGGPARTTEAHGGAADDIDPPEGFREALEADPVEGGTRTLPDADR